MPIAKPTPGNTIAKIDEMIDAINAGGGGGADLSAYVGPSISLTSTAGDVNIVSSNGVTLDSNGADATLRAGPNKTAYLVGDDGNASVTAGLDGVQLSGTKMGFFGSSSVVRPDNVSAGQALEDLGLATNVTGGGGGGAEFIVASSTYSPPAWVAKAAYICDGTADEVQINQALTDAGTTGPGGSGGGVVVLAPGFYFCAANITMKSDTHLMSSGQNPNSVALAMNNSKLTCSNAATIAVTNISVLGYLLAIAADSLVDFSSATTCFIEGLKIGMAGTSIDLSTGQRLANINLSNGGFVKGLRVESVNLDVGGLGTYVDEPAIDVTGGEGCEISNWHLSVGNVGNTTPDPTPWVVARFVLTDTEIHNLSVHGGGTIINNNDGSEMHGVASYGANGHAIMSNVGGDHTSVWHDNLVQDAGFANIPGVSGFAGYFIGGDRFRIHDNRALNMSQADYSMTVDIGATDNVISQNDFRGGAGVHDYNDAGTGTSANNNLVTTP